MGKCSDIKISVSSKSGHSSFVLSISKTFGIKPGRQFKQYPKVATTTAIITSWSGQPRNY